jgi:hypothetical protein
MAGPGVAWGIGSRRVSGVETAAAFVAEEGMEADLREQALKVCAVNALSLDGLAGWAVLHGATHLHTTTVDLFLKGWKEKV